MSKRRNRAIEFIKKHCPHATLTITAISHGLCWDDIHRHVVRDGITQQWMRLLFQLNDAEAFARFRMHDECVEALNAEERQSLIRAVVNDPVWAYTLRRYCLTLSGEEQLLLSRGVAINAEWSYYLLMNCPNLQHQEALFLCRRVAKQPWRARSLRKYCTNLGNEELQILSA